MSYPLEFCSFRETDGVGDLASPRVAPNASTMWNGTAASMAAALVGTAQDQSVVGPNNLTLQRVGDGDVSAGLRQVWKTAQVGVDQLIFEITGTGGTAIELRVNTSGQLYITGDTGAAGTITSTTVIVANTVYETEMWFHLDDTDGHWRVGHGLPGAVVEIAALVGGGVDTRQVGGAELDGVRWHNADLTFCEPIFCAAAGAFSAADFMSAQGRVPHVVISASPGNGFWNEATSGWVNVNNPGSQLAPEVDEVRSDGDVSTIIATVNGDRASFGTFDINAAAAGVSKVYALRLLFQHYCPDGFKHHQPFLRIGGTDYLGTSGGFGFQWTKTCEFYLENPATTTNWQAMSGTDAIAVINGMEVGIEHNGSTSLTRLSHVQLTVLYVTEVINVTPSPVVAPAVVPAPSLGLAVSPAPVVAIGSCPIPAFIGPPPTTTPDPVVAVGVVPVPTVTLGVPPIPQPPTVRRDTQPAFLAMLLDLLPRGFAWTREPEAVLTRWLDSVAAELAALESRVEDLLRESDPRTTLELLADWERNFGLPDPCVGPLDALNARRAALVARIASPGGGSPAFFEEYLASIGYPDARVVEFRPFTAGHSRAGDRLTSPQKPFRAGFGRAGDRLTNSEKWLHTWAIEAPFVTKQRFTAGHSVAGEPLATWGNDSLECAIEAIAPAHTFVLFLYFHLLRPDPVVATVVVPPVGLS